MKIDFKETFEVGDNSYVVDYRLGVHKGELNIEIVSIDDIPVMENLIPVDDMDKIFMKIEENHNPGEISDDIKQMEWESYENNENS